MAGKTKSPDKSPTSDLISTSALFKSNRGQTWLVDSILAAGQSCVLGGPIDCLRLAVALDLAIGISSGTPFLEKFPVPQAMSVVFVTDRSSESEVKYLAPALCDARGVSPSQCDLTWRFGLPQLGVAGAVQKFADTIVQSGAKVIILDRLHFCLLSDGGFNRSRIENGRVVHRFLEAMLAAGLSPVVVHEVKDIVSAPAFDDLSPASIGELVSQWLLLSKSKNVRDDKLPGANLVVGRNNTVSTSYPLDVRVVQVEGQKTGIRIPSVAKAAQKKRQIVRFDYSMDVVG